MGISVVLLKRDLRLFDNESVYKAILSNKKVLFLYVFEDILFGDTHYSDRHKDFVKQSIVDINNYLVKFGAKVLAVNGCIIETLTLLNNLYDIKYLYSQQETGLRISFKRDKLLRSFCINNKISWEESVTNGVFRGRSNRIGWVTIWENYMNSSLLPFSPSKAQLFGVDEITCLESSFDVADLFTEKSMYFQYGGRSTGLRYRDSFFKERYVNYSRYISKPSKARVSCSRLSPYFAWGNFSIREIYQYALAFRPQSNNKRAIDGFTTRLRWQAHFIQKFEMECAMELRSLNRGYFKLKKKVNPLYQEAWEKGRTGFPIIDACMRCLVQTGYLNFRMRAMVVSFFTHNLWQPWQNASKFLARQFLDFEPGIHFPQLQMQAGEIGINTIRIYSPVKNGLEHDPDAEFIKKWVPELANLPIAFVHEPYKMTYLEQRLFGFELGVDYSFPIVDIKLTRKKASDIIWNMRKDPDVQSESIRILNKHVVRRSRSVKL